MKRCLRKVTVGIFTLAVATTTQISLASESVDSAAAKKEELCLALASYAAGVAGAKSEGISEKKVRATIVQTSKPGEAEMVRALGNVVSYIYTVDTKPETARYSVYAKCKSGDFID